jgi:hypothetical protein
MTIRDQFNRKKRRVMSLFFAFLGIAVLGGIISNYARPFAFFMYIPALALAFLTLGYAHMFVFRCPTCGGSWASLMIHTVKWPFSSGGYARYCPFCGIDIDAKDSGKPTPDASNILD